MNRINSSVARFFCYFAFDQLCKNFTPKRVLWTYCNSRDVSNFSNINIHFIIKKTVIFNWLSWKTCDIILDRFNSNHSWIATLEFKRFFGESDCRSTSNINASRSQFKFITQSQHYKQDFINYDWKIKFLIQVWFLDKTNDSLSSSSLTAMSRLSSVTVIL